MPWRRIRRSREHQRHALRAAVFLDKQHGITCATRTSVGGGDAYDNQTVELLRVIDMEDDTNALMTREDIKLFIQELRALGIPRDKALQNILDQLTPEKHAFAKKLFDDAWPEIGLSS